MSISENPSLNPSASYTGANKGNSSVYLPDFLTVLIEARFPKPSDKLAYINEQREQLSGHLGDVEKAAEYARKSEVKEATQTLGQLAQQDITVDNMTELKKHLDVIYPSLKHAELTLSEPSREYFASKDFAVLVSMVSLMVQAQQSSMDHGQRL